MSRGVEMAFRCLTHLFQAWFISESSTVLGLSQSIPKAFPTVLHWEGIFWIYKIPLMIENDRISPAQLISCLPKLGA